MSIQEAISKRLAGKAKLPMSQREQFLERFLLLLTRRLKQGETINIPGLGAFSIRELNRRGGVEVAFTDEVQKENRIKFRITLQSIGADEDPLAGLMAGMVSSAKMDELAEEIISQGTTTADIKPDASAGLESLLESDFSEDFSSGFLIPDLPDQTDSIPEIDDLSLPDFEISADRITLAPNNKSKTPAPEPDSGQDGNLFDRSDKDSEIEPDESEDDITSFFTDAMQQNSPEVVSPPEIDNQEEDNTLIVPTLPEPEQMKPASAVKQEPAKPKSIFPADSEEAIKDSILQSMFNDATEEFPEDDEFSQAFMQSPSVLPTPDDFAGSDDDLLPDTNLPGAFDDLTTSTSSEVPVPELDTDSELTSDVFLQDALSSPVSVTEEELTESFQQVLQSEQEKIDKKPSEKIPENEPVAEDPVKKKKGLFSFLSFLTRKKVEPEGEPSEKPAKSKKKKAAVKEGTESDASKKVEKKPKKEKPESDGDEEFPIIKLVILFAALMPLTLGFVYVHFALKPSWWPFTTETELPFFEKPVQSSVIYQRQYDIPITFPYGKNEVTSYLDLNADLIKSYPLAVRNNDTVATTPHRDTVTSSGTKDTLQKSQKKETVTEEKKEEKKPEGKKETDTRTAIPTGELKQVENLIYSDGVSFAVQVSSQKRRSLAETTSVDMKRKGYAVMIREIELKSGKKKGTWYRVFVTGIQGIERAREIRKKEAAQ